MAAGLWTLVGSVVSLVNIPMSVLLFVIGVSLVVVGALDYTLQLALFKKLELGRFVIMILVVVPASIAAAGWVALVGGWALLLIAVISLCQPNLAGYFLRMGRQFGDQHWCDQPRANQASTRVADPALRSLPQPTHARSTPEVRPTPDSLPALGLPTAVAALSDHELCFAWRVSFVILQHLRQSQDTLAQSRVVGLRQMYLDEMERRNRPGFTRWLMAGARPASDPTRYLLPPAVRSGMRRNARAQTTTLRAEPQHPSL